MKKPSLDASKLKEFFVFHVEKMVMGLAVLGVVWFAYSAMQQAPYDKKPEDLQQKVQTAEKYIYETKFDPIREKVTLTPMFATMARRSSTKLLLAGYTHKQPFWDNKIINEGTKRAEPKHLEPRELEVSADVAAFAYFDPDPPQVAAVPEGGVPGANAPPEGGPRSGTRPPAGKAGKGGGKGGGAAPGGSSLSGALTGGGEGGPGGGGIGLSGKSGGGIMGPGGGPPGGILGPGGGGIGGGEGMGGQIAQGVQAPADSKIKGVQYSVVTAIFPRKEQIAAYAAVFDDARYKDPNKDFPIILGYFVQRAEVFDTSVLDPEKLNWVDLNSTPKAIDATRIEWALEAPEVVDPGYTLPKITYPLGPLLGKNWGKQVAHTKIPLLKVAVSTEQGPAKRPTINPSANSKSEFEESATETGTEQGQPGFGPGGDAGFNRSGALGGEGGYGPNRPGGLGGGRGLGGLMGEGGMGGQAAMSMVTDPDIYLVRFFDFTVEEGKRYRYRISLVFRNPNMDVSPQHLVSADLAKKKIIQGPWSAPSPLISISNFSSLLAGPVKPAEKVDEVHANMILIQYDRAKGVKAVYECRKKINPKTDDHDSDEVLRGKVLQFKRKVDVEDPQTRMPKLEEVEFLSKALVVDLKGGELMTPPVASPKDRDKEPGEIILFDSNGWLVVKSELADAADYKNELAFIDQLKNAKTLPNNFGGGEPEMPPEGAPAGRPRRPGGSGS